MHSSGLRPFLTGRRTHTERSVGNVSRLPDPQEACRDGMNFLAQIADVQALVLGVLFLWAGAWKVFFPKAHEVARNSALSALLPTRGMAQAAHVAVGASEIVVAALLLVPPHRWWASYLASALAVGFLAYLALAWRVAPEKTCSCMAGRPSRVSKRSGARACVILVLSLLAWPAQAYWGATLLISPWLILVVVVELLMLWALSPELTGFGVALQRRFFRDARLRLNPTCSGIAVDWAQVENQLQGTSQYHALASYIEGPSDRWLEDCAGFIAYAAVYDRQPVTAIFTFPVLFDPSEVAAALVDDSSNAVVTRLAPLRQ